MNKKVKKIKNKKNIKTKKKVQNPKRLKMNRKSKKSGPKITHWGEFMSLKEPKVEVHDCFTIFPPEKKNRLQRIAPVEEPQIEKRLVNQWMIVDGGNYQMSNYLLPILLKSLIIENEIVSQTIELINHTDRVQAMMNEYNDEEVGSFVQ